MAKSSNKRKRPPKKNGKKARENNLRAIADQNESVKNAAPTPPANWLNQLGPSQIGSSGYFFFIVCLIAQLATILITWPTWQLRPVAEGTIPNVPWIADTPQLSMGLLLILSLVYAAISPKKYGMATHLMVLGAAIGMDQFRCQPQILSTAFMMSACVWPTARRLCLWYLVAMWSWAGLHKFLSPDWMGQVSWLLLSELQIGIAKFFAAPGIDPDLHFQKLAIMVATTELATGVLAWIRPKLASLFCAALHLGILFSLLMMNWNFSVIPWNLAIAITGTWLLWTSNQSWSKSAATTTGAETDQPLSNQESNCETSSHRRATLPLPKTSWGRASVALMLLIPIGFYFGWVRNCFAHSLYSDNLPLGMITRSDETEFLDSWEELRFPFPNAQKTYRDYFRLTGKLNDKLHIREVKPGLKSHFYVHTGNRKIREISRVSFLDPFGTAPYGMGVDDPRIVFQFTQANVEMTKRNQSDMVYRIKFDPKSFEVEMLKRLSGFPNLQQLVLEDCELGDTDLDLIPNSNRVVEFSFDNTGVTKQGLLKLKRFPNFRRVILGGQTIAREAVDDLVDQ